MNTENNNVVAPSVKGYEIIDRHPHALYEQYLALHQGSGQHVLLTIIDTERSPLDHNQFIGLMKQLEQLRHPQVLALVDAGITPNSYYVATRYISDLTLTKRKETVLGEATILEWIKSLASILEASAEQGCSHDYLTPDDIFFDQGEQPVIGNYFFSTIQPDHKNPAAAEYQSPESIRGKPASLQSAFYSLGIIFFELLTQQTPFDSIL